MNLIFNDLHFNAPVLGILLTSQKHFGTKKVY